MKKIFIPFLLALIVAGCGQQDGEIKTLVEAEPPSEPVSLIIHPEEKEEYSLFYNMPDYVLSTYEPAEGCYLGAYVLSNKNINFDMQRFDQETGKNHAVYLYNMALRDFFPSTWVLSCISAMKTPYIVLNPPNAYNPFDKEMIDQAAESFGEFYVPMFVEFYPDPQAAHYDPEEYIDIYRYARAVFAKKASNVAFVWAVDSGNVLGSENYYPGDHSVDWVGLHVYDPIVNGKHAKDLFNAVDYFYYNHQTTKPIAISRLGVSHFSNSDHMYRVGEASTEIQKVYDRIATQYPRVKMINYMDFNALDIPSDKTVRDNFSITESNAVLSAYKEAIIPDSYLSDLVVSATGDTSMQLMRSPFTAYKVGDAFFASEKAYRYDLHILGLRDGKVINGENFYDLSFLEKNKVGRVTDDRENRKIIVTTDE